MPSSQRNRALEAVIVLLIAAVVHWLAREPWRPSQLTTVSGVVSDYDAFRSGRQRCFRIALVSVRESFELCSTAYRFFERAAFERDVQAGDSVVLRVVSEIRRNAATGEAKYWVQGVRAPDGRVYLEFDRVQVSRARERDIGRVLVIGLLAVALLYAVQAVRSRRSDTAASAG
ncbi:MAG TPA: hypothetical protein VMN60_00960 [Longimicrobiales bacterium]|nr:hypothetical protein [Longimicrobiales bacterium]